MNRTDRDILPNRRLIAALTAAACLLALFLHPASGPVHAKEALVPVRIHQVHDGDTVTLRMEGKKYRARLIGIDAPEMGQRPWGRRAKTRLIRIMRSVRWNMLVELDAERTDKYGRLLVYLWTPTKRLVNEQMIREGFAVAFSLPPNIKYADRFERAESQAREAKREIWGTNGLKQRPEEYRRAHPRKDRES